jgi:cytochrome bd-type quinol oxidase subunit 1
VPGSSVAASLALFSLAYIVILAAGCVYMVRVLRAGPDEASGGY